MKKKNPKKMQQFKVAFEDNGDLCEGQYRWMDSTQYKWEDNKPFTDTFVYYDYRGATGGNSHMLFKSAVTGRKINMFMSDFHDVLAAKRFIDNQIVGLFCYCKKGHKQAVRLILEDNP